MRKGEIIEFEGKFWEKSEFRPPNAGEIFLCDICKLVHSTQYCWTNVKVWILREVSAPPQPPANLASHDGLMRRLRRGPSVRAKFVESHVSKKLAFQIRSLRGDLSQEDMAAKVGIKQQALSRLENPYYGKATLTTLKRIATGCDVGLLVEFVPFSQLVNRVSGTPYTERGLSPETMNVPDFDEEEKQNKLSEDRDEAADQAGEPGEAVKAMTESLSRALMESTEPIERSKVWHRIVEATLASELRPLLEKARTVTNSGEDVWKGDSEALAAELGRWEKRS